MEFGRLTEFYGKTAHVTTPSTMSSSVPHVGHALTMMCCDVEKRYRELLGENPYFLTGTDENGLKVMTAAQEAGEDPMALLIGFLRRFGCAQIC
ncbi:MAG: class I tRNA ligase family protein [Fimbriimonadaceae bacterium]